MEKSKNLVSDIRARKAINDYLIVNSGMTEFEKRLHRDAFLKRDEQKEGEWMDKMTSDKSFKRAHELNHNRNERVRRYRNRISAPVEEGKAVFLTLTFSDEVMGKTSEDTRRQYVRKWLKKVSPEFFIANIDYGGETGREHYHGVATASQEAIEANPWPYGFSKAEPCAKSDTDKERLSKYIVKMTAHAFKKTVKARRCIYSRKVLLL